MPPPPGRHRFPRRHPAAAAAALLVLASGCSSSDPLAGSGTSAVPSPTASAPAGSSPAAGTTTCDYPAAPPAAKPVDPPPGTGVSTKGTVRYTLAMTGGPVTVTLDRTTAPCTVNSFASLADQHYFDGTRCHRLADSGIFILQCGDPTATGSGGPGYSFADETTGKKSYTSGVVAMANAGPDTNGSQFFLIWEDSSPLDAQPNYTIFGRMDKASRDVVAQMAGEGQDGSYGDGTGKPNNPSEISTVTRG